MLLPIQCREDLQQLAQLAAAITDAHTSAVFLPTELVTNRPSTISGVRSSSSKINPDDAIAFKQPTTSKPSRETNIDLAPGSIELVAIHSYSKLVRDCRIPVGTGLLGWVADQGRPIHLAPFEVGSGALGVYLDNEPIKSLVAVPIVIGQTDPAGARGTCGVLMCDSLRADAFPNAQVKLLEQLASHVRRLLVWVQSVVQVAQVETSWDLFKEKTAELGDAIGHSSIELLRLRLETFTELQARCGLSAAIQVYEQLWRLAQQALPPHFPLVRLPNGDVLIALDNMMSGFFQQKLHSLANHLNTPSKPVTLGIERFTPALGTLGHCNLDSTLQQQPVTKKSSSHVGGSRG